MTTLGLLLWATSSAAGPTAAEKCEAAKNKIAGKYAFCRQKAEAKAIKTGILPDYSKCDAKFGDKWAGAETKAGGLCPTVDDAPALQSCVTAHSAGVASALQAGGTCGGGALPETGETLCDPGAGPLGACPGDPPGQDGEIRAGLARSYMDNGDGTVTDSVNGLMWEKLSDDGSIHDVDDVYTWFDAFAVKIAALNAGPGFAGHTDWRLPNQFELFLGLADLGRINPAIDPAFNTGCTPACAVTACSCTQSDLNYWSSTPHSNQLNGAWAIDFYDGNVRSRHQANDSIHVRAVRGGL